MKNLTLIFISILTMVACEKEISIDLPPSQPKLVVEASINHVSPLLNYVYITNSIDYFKPDLSIGGADGALVKIIQGRILGTDTIYDGTETIFNNINSIPGIDSLLGDNPIVRNLRGIYLNINFMGQINTPYMLDITMPDGRKVNGKTFIYAPIEIDTIKYELTGEVDTAGRLDARVSFFWTDPPTQDNYRLFMTNAFTSILLGWGGADMTRTFDDVLLNNQYRAYSFFRAFKQTDTLNIYLTTVGRKEFLFWQSYGRANNTANPFATPVTIESNIQGAIGTFTGYGVSLRQAILN
jgi:hypothetical protein